jgi:hypothetical protein
VCNVHKNMRTRAYRFSGEHPAFPAQWFYGLWRALPGEPSSFATIAREKLFPANLTPASGRQNHAFSPYASATLVSRSICVHHIPPRVRDDREPPLSSGETGGFKSLICPTTEAEYFSWEGWTGFGVICPSRCFVAAGLQDFTCARRDAVGDGNAERSVGWVERLRNPSLSSVEMMGFASLYPSFDPIPSPVSKSPTRRSVIVYMNDGFREGALPILLQARLDPARATIGCAMLWQSRYRLPSKCGVIGGAGHLRHGNDTQSSPIVPLRGWVTSSPEPCQSRRRSARRPRTRRRIWQAATRLWES